MSFDPIPFLRGLYDAAVERADPRNLMDIDLPTGSTGRTGRTERSGRTVVVGAGKASAAFALALEQRGHTFDRGLLICPYGSKLEVRDIELREASHPIPDQASEDAADQVLQLAHGLNKNDHLIVLLSGGGSSLLSKPIAGLTLQEKQAITAELLKSGASIDQINTVRKHLSAIKGGRLMQAAFPASVTTLAVSDVVGDAPTTIASGPTVGDPTSLSDARAVLENHGIAPSENIAACLADVQNETPFPSDPIFQNATYRLLASPRDSLAAAEKKAREIASLNSLALTVHNLGDKIEGDVVEVSRRHSQLAQDLCQRGGHHLILSGGELTVTLPKDSPLGSAKGGPNQSYILGLLAQTPNTKGLYVMAADTDGLDGTSGVAGAFMTPQTKAKAAKLGLDPATALSRHQSSGFFSNLNQAIVTGPTHTNVNDFRAILILDETP